MVAVIDSGVHAEHPHVGSVAGGVTIEPDGEAHADYLDRLGHGTAVTAAILDKAPDADIQAGQGVRANAHYVERRLGEGDRLGR